MRATKLLGAAVAMVLASPASAVTIDYVSTGSGAYTLFAREVQETHISLLGCPDGGFFTATPADQEIHAGRLFNGVQKRRQLAVRSKRADIGDD